jgi:SHS2 domain-containing protein
MPYEYLDHTADVGIRATGADLAEALTEAARAMLRLQVPEPPEEEGREFHLDLESEDEEELVLDWLGRLLAEQDVSGVLLTDAAVEEIAATERGFALRAVATGLPPERLRTRVESEVKAVTAYGLRVTRRPGEVEVRCVVDL